MSTKRTPSPVPMSYGLMAEFETPPDIVRAAGIITKAGYRNVSGYSPFPIEELHEALNIKDRRLPGMVLAGGLLGCLGGFLLQYYVSVISYPINVGGKPFNSWPAFIPVTFEMTILTAAFVAVFGMIALNGLPRPHHPVFNVEAFRRATHDRFFLCIRSDDPLFDPVKTKDFLTGLQSTGVFEVEP